MNHKSLSPALLLVLSLGGCATAPSGGVRIDNIPMYGQPEIPRPPVLQNADKAFIEEASAGFGGNREEASRAWHAAGEEFMAQRKYDYAMRRYNQSWLLDPDNYQPYWGFGRVLLQTGKPREAIWHFETAIRLCDDDYQKVALLADAGIASSAAGDYRLANEQFQESTSLDPGYGIAWLRWSQSLYREGRYADAWIKLKQARSLGTRIPEAYVKDLKQKVPKSQ